MGIFKKIWNISKMPKELPNLCEGWQHGLVKVDGEIKHGAFVKVYHLYPEKSYCPTSLWAFDDETIFIGLQWAEKCRKIERLLELLAQGIIVAFPPNDATVVEIMRVVYKITDINSKLDQDNIILEIRDVWKQLRSEPDSLTRCRSSVKKYCDNPTQENLLFLKEIYESIPKQSRPALINMDTKDYLVRNLFNAQTQEELRIATKKLKEEIDYSWKHESFD